MLDGPGMTNSTFIEGYATDGSPHYQPYTNDLKVSHAHGWSSGPTSFLTFHIAGIKLIGPAGSKWVIEPNLGDLKRIEAGFKTSLGGFGVDVERLSNMSLVVTFETPSRTKGSLSLEHPDCEGLIEAQDVGQIEHEGPAIRHRIKKPESGKGRFHLNDLHGGKWRVTVGCD
jgi:hypothetical protein